MRYKAVLSLLALMAGASADSAAMTADPKSIMT